jgi:hypothetical protein
LHRRGTALQAGEWLLPHRAKIPRSSRSLGAGRFLRPPPSMTDWWQNENGPVGTCTLLCGLKARYIALNVSSPGNGLPAVATRAALASEMPCSARPTDGNLNPPFAWRRLVRARGVAPRSPPWRGDMLLLHHARENRCLLHAGGPGGSPPVRRADKLSPCRLWLPASYRQDPIGRKRGPASEQQPALPMGNERKIGHELCRAADPRQATWVGGDCPHSPCTGRVRATAPTIGRLDGIRTRITGLKDRHPVMLDDEAEMGGCL